MQVSSLNTAQRPAIAGNGITIRERPAASKDTEETDSAEDRQRQADADYARQLQAKLDAQEARGGARYCSVVHLSVTCIVNPLTDPQTANVT